MSAGVQVGEGGNSSIHLNRTWHAKDGDLALLSYLHSSPDLCLVLSGDDAFNCAGGVVVVRLAPISV
jgi:hypothetical protein